MKKTTSLILTLALSVSLGLAACSNDSAQSGSQSGQSEAAQSGEAIPEVDRSGEGPFPDVTGDAGKAPTIAAGTGEQPTDKIYAKTLVKGDGETVKETAAVSVNYSGALWDGTQFDTSWKDGTGTPVVFSLDGVIKGWKYGLADQKVGDRVELVIPAEWAYGEQGSGTSIPANSTLTFVVDILGTIDTTDLSALKKATPTDNKLPEGLTIEGKPGEKPELVYADGAKEPADVSVTVVDEGKGATITADDYVFYHTVMSVWGDPTQAQNTWDSAGVQQIQPGSEFFVGKKVGSRILLAGPAQGDPQSGGYPAQAQIVDIVGVLSSKAK